MPPLGPVKISIKKDGHPRRPHRFHVSRPPLTQPLDPLLCPYMGSSQVKGSNTMDGRGNFVMYITKFDYA